jgi:hypothetical protein
MAWFKATPLKGRENTTHSRSSKSSSLERFLKKTSRNRPARLRKRRRSRRAYIFGNR